MSANPIEYLSTDPSAPVLNGLAGSLIGVLRACLVTGYGTRPAAGWTEPFTGTNEAVFQLGLASTGCAIHVVSNAGHAAVRAYKSATGLGTGTDPFPTVAQAASGVFWINSATTDATVREWRIVASARKVDIFLTSTAAIEPHWHHFGDLDSFVAGDAFGCVLFGGQTSTAVSGQSRMTAHNCAATLSFSGSGNTGWICRDRAGTPGARPAGLMFHTGILGQTGPAFPAPNGAGLVYQQGLLILETDAPTAGPRGLLRDVIGSYHGQATMPASLQVIDGQNWRPVRFRDDPNGARMGHALFRVP